MAPHRPHVATVRLTESQYRLARERFARDRTGMSWQKLLTAAVNAYVRGDFQVNPDGTYTIGEPGVISYEDDADAVDLDDLAPHAGRSRKPKAVVLGTRDVAERAERETGRRVPLPLLRALLRERFPDAGQGSGAGRRYRWKPGDPEVDEIVKLIGEGVLEELREQGLRAARTHRTPHD